MENARASESGIHAESPSSQSNDPTSGRLKRKHSPSSAVTTGEGCADPMDELGERRHETR